MWTFEEFMAYQRVSPEHLAAGELAEWREAYEEACERAPDA